MMLTGYDSKRINTLFLDKSLRYHGLIQAFSRTNRLDCSAKQFGNIVCYRTTPRDVKAAVELYSKEDHDVVIVKPLDEYLTLFRGALADLRAYVPTPESVDALEGDTLARYLTCMQNFCEFSFPITLKDDISAGEYDSYKSRYLQIYNDFRKHPEKVSVVGEVSFDIELVQTDRVDVDYILNLLRKLGDGSDKKSVEIGTIIKILRKSTDPVLVSKRELLELFITTVFPILPEGASVDDELAKFLEEKQKESLQSFASEWELALDELTKLLNRYEYFMTIDYADIKALLNKKAKQRYKERHPNTSIIKANLELMDLVKEYVEEIARKYSIRA